MEIELPLYLMFINNQGRYLPIEVAAELLSHGGEVVIGAMVLERASDGNIEPRVMTHHESQMIYSLAEGYAADRL